MEKICPRCGVSSRERDFVSAFCTRCYEPHITVPAALSIPLCSRCSRAKIGKEWIPKERFSLLSFILRKCKGEIASGRYDDQKEELTLLLPAGAHFKELRFPLKIEWKKTLCTDCSRASGGYFEAIVQFRGDEKLREKLAEKFRRFIAQKTFIAHIAHVKEGIDIYTGSRPATEEVLAQLGVRSRASFKLAGVREGKRIYRATYAIRLGKLT